MASALSATVCSASSTSVFDTERMASRSLTSARPMISSVDDMGAWLLCGGWFRLVGTAVGSCRSVRSGRSGRCRSSGRTPGRGRGSRPGSMNVATNRSATAGSVRSWQSASRPWPMIVRTTHSAVSRAASGRQEALELGRAELGAEGEQRLEPVEADEGQHRTRLVLDQVLQGLVGADGGDALDERDGEHLAQRVDRGHLGRQVVEEAPQLALAAWRGSPTACRRGRPGRSWPASSRPRGRRRRRWSWPCPTGRRSAGRPRGSRVGAVVAVGVRSVSAAMSPIELRQ